MTDGEFRYAFHRNKEVVFRFAYRMTGSIPVAEDVVPGLLPRPVAETGRL